MKKIPFQAELQVVKSYQDRKGDFFVEGYAATKDFDLQGDIISVEAMEASKEDLLTNSTVLLNHDSYAPIGRVVGQDIDQKGTWVKILVDKTSKVAETGALIVDLIKQEILNKFSISATVLDSVREYVEDVGRTANVIKRMLLHEVSLVSVPANNEAKALEWYVTKALFIDKEGTHDMKKKTVRKDAPTVKALTHNSTLEEGAPGWGDVDKTQLPANAFVENAPGVDVEQKSTWTFPHHWVKDGGDLADNGIFTTGDEFLHRGGLIAAWSAAKGARSGEEAAPEIIAHLEAHRKAIGLEDEEGKVAPEPDTAKDKELEPAPEPPNATPAPEGPGKVEPKVEDEVQKKLERNKGGFPSPDALNDLWKDYCKEHGVSKNTDPADVKDHWVTFCKDSEMPEGYAYPYPHASLTTVDAIVIIAEDLMKNSDDIVVGLGSELKNLIIGMLEAEVPMPDIAASREPDPDDKTKDVDPEPGNDVQKDLQTDKDKDRKPPVVTRKGLVDDPETGKKKDTMEKQMEGMDNQQKLRHMFTKEAELLGR